MKIKRGEYWRNRHSKCVYGPSSGDFMTSEGIYEVVAITPVIKPKLWSTAAAWAWLAAWNDDCGRDGCLSVSLQGGTYAVANDSDYSRWYTSASSIRRAILNAKKELEAK